MGESSCKPSTMLRSNDHTELHNENKARQQKRYGRGRSHKVGVKFLGDCRKTGTKDKKEVLGWVLYLSKLTSSMPAFSWLIRKSGMSSRRMQSLSSVVVHSWKVFRTSSSMA